MVFLRGRIKRLYSKFVSEGDLVFDIGAHSGDMAGVLLDLKCRVVAVEPNHGCAYELKIKFNGKRNLQIVEKGVSDNEGKETFWICEGDPSISTFSKRWKVGRFSNKNWKKGYLQNVTTLDSLINEFGTPKFCKIDVEGYELKVIKGLKSKIEFFSFEFTKEQLDDTRECIEHILNIGDAKFNFSLYSDFKLFSPQWMDSKALFRELEAIPDNNLCGDIYVKME